MEIRRRPPRHPRRGPSCLLVITVLLAAVAAFFVIRNRDAVRAAVLPQPTMTPTQSPKNLAIRARLYERDGDLASAVEVYEEVIRLQPDDIRSYVALINLLVELERPQRALELAEQAVEAAPEDDQVLAVKAAAHLAYGDYLQQIGESGSRQYELAVEAGRAAIQLNGENERAYAYVAAGMVRSDIEQLPQAREAAEIALQIMEGKRLRGQTTEPLDPTVLYHYAEVLISGGFYETAQLQLETALELRRDYLDAAIELAYIYFFYRNDRIGAINLLERQVESNPEDAVLLDALAQFHLFTGQYADAQQYAEQAVAANDDMVRAHARLGHAYFQNSNYTLAIEELQRAAQGYGKPNSVTSLYFSMLGLALIYEDNANCGEALPILEEVQQVSNPGSPGALNAEEGVNICRQFRLTQP